MKQASFHSGTPITDSTPSGRLQLVDASASATRYSLLACWHLFSLDAPSVATIWTVAVARSAGVTLRWSSPTAMFVAVWMLYVADRLLDARPAANGSIPPDLEERHRFHRENRHAFFLLLLLASITLAALLHTLAAPVVHLYALLGSWLAGYFLLIHVCMFPASHRLPKEFAVGLFFSAAVFVPTVAARPDMRQRLFVPALLFAGICTLNCLYLYAWEHPLDRSHAHRTTRWATNHLPSLTLAFLACALVATGLQTIHPSGPRNLAALPFVAALSAGLLLVLHAAQGRFSRLHLRALADVTLLTPLLLLPAACQR